MGDPTKIESSPPKSDDSAPPTQILNRIGDAPIEITIELARFTITLEELHQVRVGEIMASGRPIGETVTLRAGDRTFATGELVNIDGEVGVRILRLTT